MGTFLPCAYCLEIPPLDQSRRGTIHRCPLCKTEILVTSGGDSYRLRDEEGEEIKPPPGKKNRLLAFFGIGSGV